MGIKLSLFIGDIYKLNNKGKAAYSLKAVGGYPTSKWCPVFPVSRCLCACVISSHTATELASQLTYYDTRSGLLTLRFYYKIPQLLVRFPAIFGGQPCHCAMQSYRNVQRPRNQNFLPKTIGWKQSLRPNQVYRASVPADSWIRNLKRPWDRTTTNSTVLKIFNVEDCERKYMFVLYFGVLFNWEIGIQPPFLSMVIHYKFSW